MSATPQVIAVEPLRQFCAAAFERVGAPGADAALVADTLVEADLRGVHSHGVWWVRSYTERLRRRGSNPRPNLRVVRETPAMLLLDADGALGQVASARAMHLAMEKAQAGGVGVAAVCNSNHFGAAAYYAQMAAQANQIGFATTDAEPTMAPWGGAGKLVVGNNPLAYAIPVDEDFTMVLDMAQSVVAWGKIFLAAQRGEKIPSTWALNAAGEPTKDPHEAMAGVLLPVGGYKGYGMALVMQVLSSVLSGSTFGPTMPPMADPSTPQGHGHFFFALNIEHFIPLEEFRRSMAQVMAEQRAAPLAKGVERVYLPGEIEHLKRQERLQKGIPLEAYVVEALRQVGSELALETSELRG
ncbi:MAG: malate dehydrogenase [Chloroflexi bacterium]|nr:MAG: malate dehydrogenase [Chloroflexota bacterium]